MTINKGVFGGIGDAFSDRNFRIHSIGAIASWISFFVQIVAVSWVAWELTHSTKWLAVIALLDIIPNILLLPFGGAIADRFDRYRILMLLNPLLLLQALAITALAWFNLLTIWVLAVLVLIHGILLSFSVPAMYGMLPRFVDRSCLSSAIAVNSAYTQFAVFAGPALAGWMISSYSATVAFATNAAGYMILILSMLFLKTPPDYQKPDPSNQSIMEDIVSGVRYVKGHQGIMILLGLAFVSEALGMSLYHMAPAYAEEYLSLGVEGVALLLASIGIGATCSALWLAYGGAEVVSPGRVLWAFLLATLCIALLFLPTSLYLFIFLCIVLGMAFEILSTGTVSLIQLTVDEQQRGRLMGNLWLLKQVAAGIGTYIVGAAAVSHGLRAPMLTMVSLCLIVWLVVYCRRRQFDGYFSQGCSQ